MHRPFVLLACLAATHANAQPAETIVYDVVTLATAPAAQTAEWAVDWWPVRHKEKLAERDAWVAKGESPRVVFVGDSITHGWEQAGAQLWAERFAPRGAMNIGFSGDRTENVLWRLGVGDAGEDNNELAGLSPELFVVMIGTNNTGHRQDPPAATARGIELIVDRLLELAPASRVLLLAVFPRGATPDDDLRQINDGVNAAIEKLGERERVEFLDIGEVFLDDDGVLSSEVMGDLLHPDVAGYRLWANAIEPHLKRLLGETPSP